MKLFAGLALLFSLSALAQIPASWQLMKDKKQLCQMAVPPGWTADKVMPSMVASPDKKASLIFSNKPDSVTYADLAKMAKDMFKPATILEDSPKRTYFTSVPKNGKSSIYVLCNTSPKCEAQVEFRDPTFEATAKQMLESLKPAK